MRIVVSSNPDRGHWVSDFIKSVPDDYLGLVEVIYTRGFEPEAIRRAYIKNPRDKFLFFQDSCLIKNMNGILGKTMTGVHTALLIPRPCCYLALYNPDILAQMWWPNIKANDKEESIKNETMWMDSYEETARRHYGWDQVPVLFPEVTDRKAIDEGNIHEVHGEMRLHLENDFFCKRKGTWR